jgi:hypothetical protein
MSNRYRTSAQGASYLSRITEGWTDTVLAPDIITERKPTVAAAEVIPAKTMAPEPAPAHARTRPAASPRVETSLIEARHPEMARAITLLWGFPEMNQYFDRLWMADGNQGPIDPDAMSELMLLSRVHQSIVPQSPGRSLAALYGGNRMNETDGRSRNPWNDVPPRR